MASMSLSGTSDSGADEETVGDERGSGSLTITVHDRRVLLDSMSNPPSLYALCRAWLQNDADVPTLGPQPPRPRRAAATSVGQGREAAGGAEARREASDEAKAREGDGAEPGGETSNGAEAGQGPAEKATDDADRDLLRGHLDRWRAIKRARQEKAKQALQDHERKLFSTLP